MTRSASTRASFALRRHTRARALNNGASVAAILAAAGLALGVGPAWAGGGSGVGAGGGAGGVDGGGSPTSGAGGDAASTGGAGGGGGGGVNLGTGNGAAGGAGADSNPTGNSVGATGLTGDPGQVATTPITITSAVAGGGGLLGASGVPGVSTPGGNGGGGVGVATTADVTVAGTGAVTGGQGAMSIATTDDGGAGGGGVGIFSSANVTVQAGGQVTGGAGGGTSGDGGAGGGAAAILLTGGGTVQNSGTLTGGAGGLAQFTGNPGDGGAAVQLLAGGTVVNAVGGAITGGAGGTKLGAAAFPGQGGAGIEGANVTIVNAGSITGGASTNGVLPQAAAILFTGGVNSLEIQAGSNISGNVVAFSAADTLKLGGSTDSNFNVSQIGPTAQYQGFGIYEKTGTSDWTLSGTTTAVTPWTLTQGFLTIDNDAELGAASGGLTFNGGTLEASANITSARAVTLAAGGGTLFADTGATLTLTNTVTGAGALIKDGGGAVTLEGVNTYTGLTTISAGTLGLSGAGSISDSSGVVDNGRFDISAAGASITTLSGQGVVNLASQTLALTNASGAFTGPILGGGALMVTAGAETLSGASPLTGNLTLQGTSALTLSGAPAVVSAGTIQVGATAGAGPATLTIEDGAHLDVTAPMTTSNIGAAVGSTGALVVTGAGSNLQVQDLLTVGGVSTSTGGSLTIADGATASIGILQTGILAARNAIPPTVVVTGAGSSLNAVTRIQFFGGNLSVLDGGQVTTPTLAFGANQTSNLLISGAGSSVTSSVTFGAGSTNTVTLADGGVLHSATSIPLSSGSLVINVGGAVGQAATGAGVLNVTALALGATASQVNFNHTDADYVFATVVGSQGAAEINQVAGVTHLTGASTGFGGVATVSGGALLVDGTLGSATSSVAVNGGQLGGVGTIGGNVTVNGGALAPGDSLPGTLTINGNLVLGSAANLQMQLGQAGAAGGALNSLVVVNGNLTLGGTLNVTQSAGGTFGDGVYRLIDYSGTLTDNTLAIGSLPLGTGTVQTSIANQVNLVVSGGPTLTFWNGGGQPNAGTITGGSGTWQAAGDTRWTDAAGTASGAYANGGFAIFAGQAGTVTVNNSQGQVQASGLQFATSGYDIAGAPLELTGTQADLRVGDGTAAGAAFVDTIDAQLTGSAQVEKTDLGTLVLTGSNLYTGGTAINGGVLRISSDANLGAASGGLSFDGGTLETTADIPSLRAVSLVGAGTFAPDTNTALVLLGVISGAGALNVAGPGTLALVNNETYTGGTTISGGALQLGGGGTTGSIVGDVVDNGTLAFNRSDSTTFSGAISGTGMVEQIGSGTLTLAGVNTYAGGTSIFAGTLVGSATSFGTGAIVDDGALVIDQPADPDFANPISGNGTFTKTGDGTLTLTGVNTYTGGTTISAGTLAGSATSFGMGPILDNAALVIDQPADASFADPINGSGTFTKTGAGALDYTATGTLTGATTVSAGLLTVDGSLAGSAVTVLSGATLGGAGTVGATTIQTGATIAPGGSTTTLHVNGAFAQAAGSTYQVVVNPASNASSQIAVTGTATLASGAGLNVTQSTPGDYRLGAVYTVLSATGGLSGTYALSGDIQSVSAFLALKDTYDANHAFLTVVQTASPASVAVTSNQAGAASGLPASGALTTAVMNTSSTTAAQQLLSELAADGHAAAKGVLVSDSHLVRDLAIDRLQSVFCAPAAKPGDPRPAADDACPQGGDGPSTWGQVFGAWGHTNGNGDAGDVSRSSGGFLLGLDVPVAQQWRVGGFLGYSQTGLTMDAQTASADIDSYHVGAYGGGQLGPLGLRFGATYTTHDISTDRTVALPNETDQLQANYSGHTVQGFAEIGWRLQMQRLGLEPFANVAYVTVHTASFSETGGVAAVSGAASDTDATYTTLGLRPSLDLAVGPVQARVRGVLGWRHDFGDITPTSTVRFVEGGAAFSVDGAPIERDAGVAEMALDLKTSSVTVLSLSYGAQGWDGDIDQTIRANFHLSF